MVRTLKQRGHTEHLRCSHAPACYKLLAERAIREFAGFSCRRGKTTACGCRIRWIAAALPRYYCAGGRWEKQQRKDARRLARYRMLPDIIKELEEAQNCDYVRIEGQSPVMEKDSTGTSEGIEDPVQTRLQLKVLDGGSCFNPLQQFRCEKVNQAISVVEWRIRIPIRIQHFK
jgi:hypothetical protein